jgi:hypothetical protein
MFYSSYFLDFLKENEDVVHYSEICNACIQKLTGWKKENNAHIHAENILVHVSKIIFSCDATCFLITRLTSIELLDDHVIDSFEFIVSLIHLT